MLIIILISFPKAINSPMKESSAKTLLSQNLQQNQSSRFEGKPPRQNPQHCRNQEVKDLEKEPEFQIKKQEKRGRKRAKQTEPDAKQLNQNPSRLQPHRTLYQPPKQQSLLDKQFNIRKQAQKQQYVQNKLLQKIKKRNSHPTDHFSPDLSPSKKQTLRKAKQEAKDLKKAQKALKQKNQFQDFHGQMSEEGSCLKKTHEQHYSQQLTTIFRENYPYYMIGSTIVFPIEDSLFLKYPELSKNLTQGTASISLEGTQRLERHFCKELQIWNMIVQNAKFFEINEEIKIEDIPQMLSLESVSQKKLFKSFHRFYISDILYHRYEQSSNQDYYSFISLWRYADENGFLDKIFNTCWNKFIHFYISTVRSHYTNLSILDQFRVFQQVLNQQMANGEFLLPQNYEELLDYIIFLIDMSFETYTFKALINGKMLFFRDNNKMKNQLLEDKKKKDNEVWELKEEEKMLIKKEKQAQKLFKKESKNHVDTTKLTALKKELSAIFQSRQEIQTKKEELNQKVIDIDNKVYELCCLPQFSNVWLLGEDRYRNLYWFIRQQEEAIYRQQYDSGDWAAIRLNNIERFHQSLNPKGIRERKLYEKILYYKQLGYIKTSKESTNQVIQAQNSSPLSYNQLKQPENLSGNEMQQNSKQSHNQIDWNSKSVIDVNDYQKFAYGEYVQITPFIVKLMILKSEYMMTKYLYERNSKWTSQDLRLQYISKINHCDLTDLSIYDALTNDLRIFNEKICVVEINIKVFNQSENVDLRTRKIQTKIWGINQKYKHFWYDYSRKCKNLSDLHLLVSILYLTIEKYVTKTRKPNNTKYFFKTVEFGQPQDTCELCQLGGEVGNCSDCQGVFHLSCLAKHGQSCRQKSKKEMEQVKSQNVQGEHERRLVELDDLIQL